MVYSIGKGPQLEEKRLPKGRISSVVHVAIWVKCFRKSNYVRNLFNQSNSHLD